MQDYCFFSKVHSNVDYIETENERQRKKIDQNEKKNKTKKEMRKKIGNTEKRRISEMWTESDQEGERHRKK